MEDPLAVECRDPLEDPAQEPQRADGVDPAPARELDAIGQGDAVATAFHELDREPGEQHRVPVDLDLGAPRTVVSDDELAGRLSLHHAAEGGGLAAEEVRGVDAHPPRLALGGRLEELDRDTRGRGRRQDVGALRGVELGQEDGGHRARSEPP